MKKIEAAVDAKLNNSCDATREEEEVLIYGRNAAWLKVMPQVEGIY